MTSTQRRKAKFKFFTGRRMTSGLILTVWVSGMGMLTGILARSVWCYLALWPGKF